MVNSTENLRKYAADCSTCRWRGLLRLLGEQGGANCGTCDNCATAKEHRGDVERDYSGEAKVLLGAVQAAGGKAWSHIEKFLDAGDGSGTRTVAAARRTPPTPPTPPRPHVTAVHASQRQLHRATC